MALTQSQKNIAAAKKYLFEPEDDDNWFTRGMKGGGQFLFGAPMEVGGMINDAVRGDLMGDPNYDRDWTGGDAMDAALTAAELIPAFKAAKKGKEGFDAAVNLGKEFLTPKNYIKPGLQVGVGATALGAGMDALDFREAPSSNDAGFPVQPTGQRSLDDLLADPEYQQNVEAREPAPQGNSPGVNSFRAADAMGGFSGKRSHNELIKEGIQRDQLNRSRRDMKREDSRDNRKAKQEARTREIMEGREADMREAWNKSPHGALATGKSFDELDADTQAQMRERYIKSKTAGAYNSADDAREKRRNKTLQEIAASGNIYVDPNDPENKNGAPGQVSREEYMARTGMENPGTAMFKHDDGRIETVEFGDAFERAGGMDTAKQVLAPAARGGSLSMGSEPYRPENAGAMLANLRNQGAADNRFTFKDGSKFNVNVNKGTRRMTNDMQDYGDAMFTNEQDALNYLNRGSLNEPYQKPSLDEPSPAPQTDEDGMPLWPFLTAAGLGAAEAGRRYLDRRLPGSGNLIKRGVNKLKDKFNPKMTMGPDGPIKLQRNASIPTPQGVPLHPGGMPKKITPEQFRRAKDGTDVSTQNIINHHRRQQQLALPEKGVARKFEPRQLTPGEYRRLQSGGLDPSGQRIVQEAKKKRFFDNFSAEDLNPADFFGR
jgi:hypothetical protein